METFVIAFVVVMAWGFFAAMGSPGALRVGDAFLIGLVLIGCVVGFALLVAVPFGIIGMIFAAAFA